jgi:uncharacterized protein (DUF1800 family)
MTSRRPRKNVFGSGTLREAVSAILAVGLASSLILGFMAPVQADSKASKSKTPARLTDDKKILHLLDRIGFGARPGDVERVRQIGIDKYLDQQLHPEHVNDSAVEARLSGLPSLHMDVAEAYEKYPQPNQIARELGIKNKKQQNAPPMAKPSGPAANPDGSNGAVQQGSQAEDTEAKQKEDRRAVLAYYDQHNLKPPQRLLQELQAQKLIRGVYSDRQLQEVMTDFWFNHFNIYWPKGQDKWMVTEYELNAIRPHTLGKFKDLLMATAKSPAMLFYLDNFLSSSPNARQPQRPGMYQRRSIFGPFGPPPGRVQMDPQQRQQQAQAAAKKRKPGINENYARELMELHTLGVDGGYTQKDVQEVARCFTGWTIDRPAKAGKFVFRDGMHDDGEKTVLGQKISAGGGERDGEKVLDILAHSPVTAKFISTKLVRRFVSDTPPPALVDKVSAVYLKTDGDIREMLRTVFTSPEFWSPEAYRAKIKSPFELAVSAIRATNGDTDGSPRLAQFIGRMGQPLYQYQAPTGYPDRAEQWVNTGALLERLNFGLALSANRIPGTTVGVDRLADGTSAADSNRLMDRAIAVLLGGDVSPQTRAILDKQLTEGVPVKGDLGATGASATSPDATGPKRAGPDTMDSDSAAVMSTGDNARPLGKTARKDYKAARTFPGNPSPGPAVDSQVAMVFGLVLGSPEFQRR